MRGLRSQLSLTIIFIVLFTVALTGFLSNLFIQRDFEKYIIRQQENKSAEIAAGLSQIYNSTTGEWDISYIYGIGMYALEDGYIVKVLDKYGQPVWDAEKHDMTRCARVMDEISDRMAKRGANGEGGIVSREYNIEQDGEKIGAVLISYYGPYFFNENDFRFIDELNRILILIGILSLILSIITGGILARRIARPITKTVFIAKQISEGNYDIRFSDKPKTKELNDLAHSINQLATALGEQEKIRKQLTSDVAHELRTPLATVSSHLEAMIEGIWEPTKKRLQSCFEETGRLKKLIADLERLAKIESDNPALNKTPVDLMDIARPVSDNFELELKKKNLSLTLGGESVFVMGDKDRLGQVIINLLSNAVKFTPENGNIKISVGTVGDYANITVEDNGPGIPDSDLPFIMERFYRADKSRHRNTGGTGIGLAIVKSIVLAHGGKVMAESEVGKGSRFIVQLPKYDTP